MKKLLIRADDLGYSEGINYGIAKAVKDGIIRTVGVMPNMLTVAHGLDLLREEKLCYGQHTNICVGKPLTDPCKIPSLVDENGNFKSSKVYRNSEKDFVVLEEVIVEIEAQYQRFIELVGEKPHYFEGHAVASDNFFKGLQIVAQKYGLRYLPMPVAGKTVSFGSTKLHIRAEGSKLGYDPFETMKEVVLSVPEDECAMMVCHPGYLDAYILKNSSMTVARALEVEMLCSKNTKKWLEDNHICLVTYDEL